MHTTHPKAPMGDNIIGETFFVVQPCQSLNHYVGIATAIYCYDSHTRTIYAGEIKTDGDLKIYSTAEEDSARAVRG